MRTHIAVEVLVGTLALPLVVHAQSNVFESGVDLVALDVHVRDLKGRVVSDLDAPDFVVRENGVPQDVAMLARSRNLPVDAVLVLDHSSSMSGVKDQQTRAAAAAFAATLRSDDRFEIVTFADRATVARPFAHGTAGVQIAWTAPGGGTALYDALAVAVHRLVSLPTDSERRKVVALLSDGDDTRSVLDYEAVLPTLHRSGALVYVVRIQDGAVATLSRPLRQLAAETGAQAIAVTDATTLPQWFRHIGEEVRSLYRLGYVSSDWRKDGAWRRVEVQVPGLSAQVRTRSGYYASTPVQSR